MARIQQMTVAVRVTNPATGEEESIQISGCWGPDSSMTVGSDPTCDIVLPSRQVPPLTGQVPSVAAHLFPAVHWHMTVVEGEVLVGNPPSPIFVGGKLRGFYDPRFDEQPTHVSQGERVRIGGLGNPWPLRIGPFDIDIAISRDR